MDGESPKTPPPVPEINAEWIYETHQQQQRTNAMILQLLQNQQTQNPGPSSNQGHAPVDPPTPPTRPKHTLPQPEYTHEDPALYPQFRGLIAQKLRVDALACGDSEYDRVWYGFACLKGIAALRIFPWIDYAQKSGVTFRIQGFLGQLDLAFSDPQKAQKAIAKINQIRQGKTPFREFLRNSNRLFLRPVGGDGTTLCEKDISKPESTIGLSPS